MLNLILTRLFVIWVGTGLVLTTTTRGPCPKDQFSCGADTCIPDRWVCDGDVDCMSGLDERQNCSRPTRACQANQFSCGANVCIPDKWICDGEADCRNGLDEQNCSIRMCQTNQFSCGANVCIPDWWVCDGEADCLSGLDERQNCSEGREGPRTCSAEEFMCDNSDCIHKSWTCDGESDCADNSDERNCDSEAPLYNSTTSHYSLYSSRSTARLDPTIVPYKSTARLDPTTVSYTSTARLHPTTVPSISTARLHPTTPSPTSTTRLDTTTSSPASTVRLDPTTSSPASTARFYPITLSSASTEKTTIYSKLRRSYSSTIALTQSTTILRILSTAFGYTTKRFVLNTSTFTARNNETTSRHTSEEASSLYLIVQPNVTTPRKTQLEPVNSTSSISFSTTVPFISGSTLPTSASHAVITPTTTWTVNNTAHQQNNTIRKFNYALETSNNRTELQSDSPETFNRTTETPKNMTKVPIEITKAHIYYETENSPEETTDVSMKMSEQD